MKIKIKKLRDDVKLPSYANPGDAAMDVYSQEDKILQVGEQYKFNLGFALEFDHGYVGLFMDKSSMGAKGIKVMGGVLDASYRGEYMLMLRNLSDTDYEFKKGDKLAQLLIMPVAICELDEVSELSDSVRGEGGFGSSGK